jgi:hypothetical protein
MILKEGGDAAAEGRLAIEGGIARLTSPPHSLADRYEPVRGSSCDYGGFWKKSHNQCTDPLKRVSAPGAGGHNRGARVVPASE